LNAIDPHFIRIRTFVPKIDTPLLDEVQKGSFRILGPHGILRETEMLIRDIEVSSYLLPATITPIISTWKVDCLKKKKDFLMKSTPRLKKMRKPTGRFSLGPNNTGILHIS